MAMDFDRIIQAAAEAALQGKNSAQQSPQDGGKSKRKGLTAPRALLIGAGVYTAGRLLVGSRGRDMVDNLQQRLASFESDLLGGGEQDDEEDFDEDEELDDEPEGEYNEDEEPEGEYDEDEEPEGEYDEDGEPEGEYEEDEEPEGEYDEDEEPEAEYEEDEEPEDEVDEEDEEPEERPRRRSTSSAGSRNGRH